MNVQAEKIKREEVKKETNCIENKVKCLKIFLVRYTTYTPALQYDYQFL